VTQRPLPSNRKVHSSSSTRSSGPSRPRARPAAAAPAHTLDEIDIPSQEPISITSFSELDLAQPLRDALAADGYVHPTPIQARAIPPALTGRDMLGIAQTGTGKTAAFALPILEQLLKAGIPGTHPQRGRRPKALVLAPTRELAAQIAESFASYGRHTSIRVAVIFGGVGQDSQVRSIRQGIDVLIATPGRLTDLYDQRLIDFSEISFFVLDEADRMLDMGFIQPIRKIASLLPVKRQTMLFSATMPKEIRHLAAALLHEPAMVSVTPVSSAVDRIEQKLYFVQKAQKTALFVHLFDEMCMDRVVVFTKTKHGADRLARKLYANGIDAEAIHGNKNQNQRVRALDAFKSGKSPVLVATDVAARGLDIDDVTHVVNFDLPMEPEAYVHRIGRTARAGKSGHAVSFCDSEETTQLKQVERLVKFEIPRERLPAGIPEIEESAAPRPVHLAAPAPALGGNSGASRQPAQGVTRGAPAPVGTANGRGAGAGRSGASGHDSRRHDNPRAATPRGPSPAPNANAVARPARADALPSNAAPRHRPRPR
jgi:ATP-dependent RNA helicase RhlE